MKPSTKTTERAISPTRRILLLAALAGALGLARGGAARADTTPAEPDGEGARRVVAEVTEEVAGVLLDDSIPDPEKRQRVQRVLDANVDFPTTSKLILARNYRKFSDAQRLEFVEQFRKHLMYTYWKNASGTEFDRIEITGDRKELRKDWTVKSEVVIGSDRTTMDYRLRFFEDEEGEGGEWRIIDLTIEGVSLIANFRSQFQEIVADRGPDGLLELLRKKNAEAEERLNRE